MPRLQILTKEKPRSFFNTLNYVARPDKCQQGCYGMTNVYNDPSLSPETVIENAAWTLRDKYGKIDQRYAMHEILTFSPEECKYLDHKKVLEIGYHMAESAFPDCISFFAVHDHSNLLHLDLMVIPIDLHTGSNYDCGSAGAYHICSDVTSYLEKYVPKDKISKTRIAFGKTKQTSPE